MKAFTTLILATIVISLSIFASIAVASAEPVVGVKAGDWIEYSVTVTGGVPPPKLNLTSFRMEVLAVEGAAFEANFTSRFANGTVSSAVWRYNFTDGKTGGWTIIPAGLGVGDVFYDSYKPGNVTVMGEDQKAVAGATRTITHSSDAKREIKEWDKATGVFTYAVEHPRNLTLTATAVATNLWSAQAAAVQLNQTPFYPLIGALVLAIAAFSAVIILMRKKGFTMQTPKLQKIVALAVFTVLLLAIGAVGSVPMSDSGLPLSFRDINVIMQTLWMSILLAGMYFRSRGNYFMHEILTIITVAATLISFGAVLAMPPSSGSETTAYFSNPVNVFALIAHSVVSLPALVFGVWLVALWRPNSVLYAAKSRKIARLTVFFWVASYVLGILDYLLIRIAIFG